MKKAFVLLFSLLCASGLLLSQDGPVSTKSKKAAKLYEEAKKYYDARQNDNAVELLKKAVKEDSNFIEAQGMLGYVYQDMNKGEEAIGAFKEVIRINPGYFPNIFYDVAKLELETERYADAQAHLHYYLQHARVDNKMEHEVNLLLDDCEYAAEAKKHPVPFNPVNLGPSINTKLSEYFPTLTVDGQMILFTRRLTVGDGQGLPGQDFQEDFYISYKANGQWGEAMNAGQQLNTEYNEGASTISADGNLLIFTSNRLGGLGSCDLYYAFNIGNGWSRARNLGRPVNSRDWESQPSLSSDGKTLYFIRGYVEGYTVKNQDIYMTTLNDSDMWTRPVKLSDTINTPGMEESPFISPDNQTLYFSSDGHPGMGGLDVFMSL